MAVDEVMVTAKARERQEEIADLRQRIRELEHELDLLHISVTHTESAWHFTVKALGQALSDLEVFRAYAKITCGHCDAPADLIEAVKARLER